MENLKKRTNMEKVIAFNPIEKKKELDNSHDAVVRRLKPDDFSENFKEKNEELKNKIMEVMNH